MNTQRNLDDDEYAWVNQQMELLCQNRVNDIDAMGLVTYLADKLVRQEFALKHTLRDIMVIMLKYAHPVKNKKRSPRSGGLLLKHRYLLQETLSTSPSLRDYLEDIFVYTYDEAQGIMIHETGLPTNTLPEAPPWSLDEILNDHFLPKRP